MSVCASTSSSYGCRQMPSQSSRQNLTNNERWAALNKQTFQEILNAILFQTIFSSGGGGVIRHLPNTQPTNRWNLSRKGADPSDAEENENVERKIEKISNVEKKSEEEEKSERKSETGKVFPTSRASVIHSNSLRRSSAEGVSCGNSISITESQITCKTGEEFLRKESENTCCGTGTSPALNDVGKRKKTFYGSDLECSEYIKQQSSSPAFISAGLHGKEPSGYAGLVDGIDRLKNNLDTYLGCRLNIMINLEKKSQVGVPQGRILSPDNSCFALLPHPRSPREYSTETIAGHRRKHNSVSNDTQCQRKANSKELVSQNNLHISTEISRLFPPPCFREPFLRNMSISAEYSPAGTSQSSQTSPAVRATVGGGTKRSRDHSILKILGHLTKPNDNNVPTNPTPRMIEDKGGLSQKVSEPNRRNRWLAVDKNVLYKLVDILLSVGDENSIQIGGSYFSTDGSDCFMVGRADVMMDYRCSSKPGKYFQLMSSDGKEIIATNNPGKDSFDERLKISPGSRGIVASPSVNRQYSELQRCLGGPERERSALDKNHGRKSVPVAPSPEKKEDDPANMSVLRSLLNDDDPWMVPANSKASFLPTEITVPKNPAMESSEVDDSVSAKSSSFKRSKRQRVDKKRRKTTPQSKNEENDESEVSAGVSEDGSKMETDSDELNRSQSFKWKSSMLMRMRHESATDNSEFDST